MRHGHRLLLFSFFGLELPSLHAAATIVAVHADNSIFVLLFCFQMNDSCKMTIFERIKQTKVKAHVHIFAISLFNFAARTNTWTDIEHRWDDDILCIYSCIDDDRAPINHIRLSIAPDRRPCVGDGNSSGNAFSFNDQISICF